MDFFNWSESLATGHHKIDADHKQLISLINRLHSAMSDGQDMFLLGDMLKDLAQYTRDHFDREELLMQRIQYEDYLGHKAEHAELISQLILLQKKFEVGAATLSGDVFMFLSDWLRTHIQSSDVKLGAASQRVSARFESGWATRASFGRPFLC